MAKKTTAKSKQAPLGTRSIADYFVRMPQKRKHTPPTPVSCREISDSPAKKKPRLSLSPALQVHAPASDEIPGSLSDEQELVPPRHSTRDMDAVNENVNKWREDASSVDSLFGDSIQWTPEQGTSPSFFRQITPPTSEERSRSLSPVTALTTEARTAQVLARIKAEAAEKARMETDGEDVVPEFKDVLSDSDDDMVDPSSLLLDRKGKGKQKAVVFVEIPKTYDLRNSANNRSSVSPPPARTRTAVDKNPSGSKKPATKKVNPFTQLLKEKRQDEKAGRNDESRRRAERIALGEEDSMMDMDDDDEHDPLFDNDTSSPGGTPSSEDLKFDSDDEKRFYGQNDGAITSILAVEKKRRDIAEQESQKFGLPFWIRRTPIWTSTLGVGTFNRLLFNAICSLILMVGVGGGSSFSTGLRGPVDDFVRVLTGVAALTGVVVPMRDFGGEGEGNGSDRGLREADAT
ncbi:hypothetical protein K435DRAFT_857521 [Dendrothele bispora CBS 962.96]|uniref:Uncharacterized protein n=1 Tax=Dendrothele bispora (strain CBS 962.96) TaxID=1314807 RepID=A0A4S8M5G8_DENBC|nr:hypothetical protein K435DRAFT_857521 [Dendrothele bispora CBS 962.96]